jgi:Trypsin
MKRLLLASTMLMSVQAYALEGELAGNKFPYVILLVNLKTSNICTTTVLNPALVLTAAHCMIDPKTHTYDNLEDIRLIAASDAWSIPKEKIHSTSYKVKTFFSNTTMPDRLREKRTIDDRTRSDLSNPFGVKDRLVATLNATVADIAYLIPDRPIKVSNYARWVFDYMNPTEYSGNWMLSQQQLPAIYNKFYENFGSQKRNAILVGYGLYGCTHRDAMVAWDNRHCVKDGSGVKRWTVVPFAARLFNQSQLGSVEFMNLKFSYSNPWFWNTGLNAAGASPILGGDSGGPLMIPVNGEDVVIGVSSTGGNDYATFINPLVNPNLYWIAINSKEYKSLKGK